MKKFPLFLLTGIACALLTACATSSSTVRPGHTFSATDKVAVVTESSVLNETQKKEVADLFSMALLRRGYDVVDRANLEQITKEASLQNESGISSPEGRARLAVNNIQGLVVVNLTTFDDSIAMTAKMVDVASGSLLWVGQSTGKLHSTLATFGGAVLGAVTGAVVGHQFEDSKVEGAVIGGILGGFAGHALKPEQADLIRTVIDKITEELPHLVLAQ